MHKDTSTTKNNYKVLRPSATSAVAASKHALRVLSSTQTLLFKHAHQVIRGSDKRETRKKRFVNNKSVFMAVPLHYTYTVQT